MTIYRDRLITDFDNEIGSTVGCGLDRLNRVMKQTVGNVEPGTFNFGDSARAKLVEIEDGQHC